MKSRAEASSAEILLEIIQDMHSREQIVTRETLQTQGAQAGLTKTQIDDRLAYLEGKGLIVRVQRGVYVPAEQHKPARLITRSLLPDGTSVLEIGDQVTMLTPREARMLGEIMAGSGQLYALIEMGHKATQAYHGVFQEVREMRQQQQQEQQERQVLQEWQAQRGIFVVRGQTGQPVLVQVGGVGNA